MTGQDVWSLLSTQVTSSQGGNSTATSSLRRSSSTNNNQDAAAEKVEGGGAEGNDKTSSRDNVDEAAAEEEVEGAAATTAAVQAFSSFALCVGMPGAGKSSLLNTYLNPNNDGVPKPTVALEYMFARRTSVANAPKDVAHIWELGGGSHVSDLVRVPITPDRFHDALYIIVVDLSKPSSVIPHLLYWTDQIKACVKVCVRDIAKRDPTFADELKKKTYAKLGRDHPDVRAVRPCPVPLVVVGNKYDIFKNYESVRRRTLAQALRFIAHINGASLLFCSSKEKRLKDTLRQTLNTHLFRASARKLSETNPERPLVVTAGSDSLDSILKPTPPATRREDFVSGNAVTDGAMDTWKRAVEDVFGTPDLNDELPVTPSGGEFGDGGGSEGNSNPFPEAAVDEHRAQRDEILRRYRKDAERKAKLAVKAADAPRRGSRAAPPSARRPKQSDDSKPLPPASRK